MTTLTFSQDTDGRYKSDNITATASNIAVQVKFKGESGSVYVERSINGTDWYVGGVVQGIDVPQKLVEFNVSGIVAGQMLRICSNKEIESAGYIA